MIILQLLMIAAVPGQAETLTNNDVIEMTRAGMGNDLILKKINESGQNFDTSAKAIIELKKAGVADAVIAAMMDRVKNAPSKSTLPDEKKPADVGGEPAKVEAKPPARPGTSRESLLSAKTIALEKSSVHPSRQALEKELLKRKDWQQLNLTILRYKEEADLYVEIGFVSGSWVTHRYVYRIYDRRNGAVIAAGETTSWGSLAENLARHIAKSLNKVLNG